MSHISMGRVGALLSRRCKHFQRKSQQRNYRKLFLHRPGMEGLEPRLMLASDLLIADVVSDSILRFDGNTGAPLGPFVTSGSGELVDPLDPEFGPDGNLYVISNNLGQVKVLRYNGTTGAPLGTFVDLGAGSASAIEFGPDGNLYLATISETGVLRFNGTTGQPMGVAASGNGIRRASGIDFGPDGKLYVLDSDRVIDVSADRVLRFDPSNGAFIDQFVAPGQLNDTVFLTFGPDNHLYVPDIQVFHDVRRFSGTTGKFLGAFANSPDPADNPIFDIQFGPDGNAYASTGEDILRFDGETGRLLDTFVAGTGGFITFFPPVGPATDLAVGSIDIPVGVVQGNDLSITYTVTNNSASPTAVNSWDDVVYLSTDALFDPTDVELGRIAHTSGLPGGVSYTETLTTQLPMVLLGDYYVFVFADRRGAVNDTARLNNLGVATKTLEVFPPLATSHDSDHSIAVGRTLSAYTTHDIVNGELTITYTVYNLTDGYVRGTLLTTTLGTGVTFVSASQLPVRSEQDLAWSLGVIAPYGRSSVELVVSLDASNLLRPDGGPRAFGTLDTVAVQDSLPPVVIRSNVIDPTLLAATPDANSNDPFIQEKAAELDYDVQNMVDFLRNEISYESYAGSLRGARGTLWSKAGNSLDQSSLMIALMRASGIPARYARGQLSDLETRNLIESMFPSQFQVIGFVPEGDDIFDPTIDPRLLSETRDHYWTQIDTGNGYKDFDPSFGNGALGQSFTSEDIIFSETPDPLRHVVTVRLKRELTSASLFGDALQSTETVLEVKFTSAELVGRPLSVGHFVNSTGLSAIIFNSKTNIFQPYLIVGDIGSDIFSDTLIRGDSYQEVATNFPFGSQVLTGLFLEIDVQSPDKALETLTRTLLDRIGFDIRKHGGSPAFSSEINAPPPISEFDITTIAISPSLISRTVPLRDAAVSADLQRQAVERFTTLPAASQNSANFASDKSLDNDIAEFTRLLLIASQRAQLNFFTLLSDSNTAQLAATFGTLAYHDSPRILITSSRLNTTSSLVGSTITFAIDLRKDDIRVVPFPGQNVKVPVLFRVQRGVDETVAESFALRSIVSAPVNLDIKVSIGTIDVFSAARIAGVGIGMISQVNLSSMDSFDISEEAKSRISTAVLSGKVVVVPTQSVLVGTVSTIAWFEHDPVTGETISVLEDGGHSDTVETGFLYTEIFFNVSNFLSAGLFAFGVFEGFLTAQIALMSYFNNPKEFAKFKAALFRAITDEMAFVAGYLALSGFPGAGAGLFAGFNAGLAAGQKLIAQRTGVIDPPIMNFRSNLKLPMITESNSALAMVIAPSQKIDDHATGNVATRSFSANGALNASFTSEATNVLSIQGLFAENSVVVDRLGSLVGSGRLVLDRTRTISASVAGNVEYNIVGDGAIAYYARASSQSAFSSDWNDYTAELGGSIQVTLLTDGLVLNGIPLPLGFYTINTSAVTLIGSGSVASDLAGFMSLIIHGGNIYLGPSIGVVSIGGVATPLENSVSLNGFDGTVDVSGGVDSINVVLEGNIQNIVRIVKNPLEIVTDQNSSVMFHLDIATSFADKYELEVEAPVGWGVQVSEQGLVTIQPRPGVQNGDYRMSIIARSSTNPAIIASGEFNVKVVPTAPSIKLMVQPDDLYFVPVGGGQLPSVFRATVQNLGPETEKIDFTFTGLPPDFEVFSSADSADVPPGESGILGFHLNPLARLPAPGTDASFSVNASSRANPAIAATQLVTFTVPEVHGVNVTAEPSIINAIPGSEVALKLLVASVGNVPETVTFDLELSPGLILTDLPNYSLVPGQVSTQSITISVAPGTPLNSTLQAVIIAFFGGREPVAITIPVRVAAPGADAVARSAYAADLLGYQDLANRLHEIGIAITSLVETPTESIPKAQALVSLESTVSLLAVDPVLVSFMKPLEAARDKLAAASTPNEVLAALTQIGAVLDDFGDAVSALARSNFELFLLPNSQVALPQTPTQFELRIHNIGTDTSTYNVALNGVPAGVTATLSDQQVTLDRDEFASVMVTLTQTATNELVEFGFSVDVTVEGASQITKSAKGSMTARKEFVSVVALTATPPFTEEGGTLVVSTRLLNAVNREQKARASFVVRNSSGTQVGATSGPVDVTLTVQTSLVTLPLGSIDTTGLSNGSYSIVMTLVDMEGKAIPGGTGSTNFLVGSPLTASIDVAPGVLPPGTSTVTNTLKIEALAPLVSPPTLIGQAVAAGSSDVVRNGDFVYVASPDGIRVFDIAGANLQNPQLLRTVGPATTLIEQRGDLLVSVLSRPGGGSTALTMFSLADSANPTQLGTTGDIPYGTAADLIVTDTHAFIVLVNFVFTLNHDIIDQNGGLIAINISDPAAPFFDGDAVSAKGTPAGRDGVNDGVLFNDNGTNNDGIKTPLGIDQSGGNQNTWSVVQVSPTILLLSGSTATGTDTQIGVGVVRVVDISDPRNMLLVRDLQIPGTVHVLDVAVSGNRALLTASQGGFADLTTDFPFTGNVVLATLNISDPANPQIIHQQTLDRSARGFDHATVLGNGLYAIANLGATTDQPGLFMVDASDPNNLGIGGIDVPAGINELIGGDGLIFTTDGASLIVYQVPSNQPLTLEGQVPVTGGLRSIAARGNIAYASGVNGIQIIDYSDPANPTIVGTLPGNHYGAKIQDNVLLALRPSGSAAILDVYALQDTPLAPPLIGSSEPIRYDLLIDLQSNSTHAFVTQFQVCVIINNQDAYFQGGDMISIALNLDDVDNPTSAAPAIDNVLFNNNGNNIPAPGDVGGCPQNGGNNNVWGVELVNASTAYLATTTATGTNTQLGVGRISVVDISDSTSPSVLSSLDIPGTVHAIGVGVSGNVGVVIGSTGGFGDNPFELLTGNLTVTTLDVSDPLDPRIITTRILDRVSTTFWSTFANLGDGLFGYSNLGYENGEPNPAVIIIDASNPRSPLIGQSSIPAELIAVNSLFTDGEFLFTADSGGLSIYTVNPLPGLPVTARVQIPNGTGVAPIPGSFNIPPAEVISGLDSDTYVFDLTLAPSLPSETLTWQSVVVGLQPGESRPVTLGTTIDFAFQGTAGQIALPRTVVAAEQIMSLDPASQTVRPGDQAEFNVTFTNPASVAVTYGLSVGGVPSEWVAIDSSVTVPAGGTATKSLRLSTGAFDVIGDYGFLVNAVVDGVRSSVAGTLVLAGIPILPEAKPQSQGVVVTLTPTSATAGQGTAATYVARIYNVGSQTDRFALSAAGLPSGFQTTFAVDNISVPPGASNFRDVLLTIVPPLGTDADDYDFTVTATSADDASITGAATSTLSVLDIGVSVEVTPESGSPESTYEMLVTNTGQVRETYDLSLAAPAALMATLGETSVTLDPGQSISIPIDVGAIDFAFPGSLSLIGVATSRSNPLVRAADGVGVDIAGLIAMTAAFDNPTQVLPLPGTSSFLLLVDNIGNLEDQYSATITRTSGSIVANLVGLQGENTQSVPLFILPGLSRGAILLNAELLSAGMGTITVMVKSLTDSSVSTEITAQLQAGEQAEVRADLSISVLPSASTAMPGDTISFTVTLNNSGPDTATGIQVSAVQTPNLLNEVRTPSVGSIEGDRWLIPALAAGSSVTLTITGRVAAGATAVTSTSEVIAVDQGDPDSIPNNHLVEDDLATVQVSIVSLSPIADLSLVVTVDNGSANVGQNVTFTVALNNAGPDGATGVSVLDKLPTGLQFVNATTSTGSYSATTGVWNVGSLAQGATTTLTIVAKLLTDQAVSNVAQVATSDQFDPDSTPGNNLIGEDDQFSAGVGTCLTAGSLVAGMNRLVFSCVTPGGFAAFVIGTQAGSHYYSKWGTTVDIADPGVPAIGVGNINGVAVVLVNLTEAQLAHPLYVQAFEMLPAHKVSNLIVAQHSPDTTGVPLVADTLGLGTSPGSLAVLKSGTPVLKAAALAHWQAAGVSELILKHLAAIDILFSDLPNDQLAATQGNFIVLDSNAAGHGWFVDATPGNNVEFTHDASGSLLANTDAARGHIDALTVILHEMGHVLGEPDEPNGSMNRLMSESLSPGMRRLPTAVTTPSLVALDVNRDGFVTPMDALLIINELNRATGGFARTTVTGNVLDVTGDGLLTPIDALQVINYLNRVSPLNRSSAVGEGESIAREYEGDSGYHSAVDSTLVDDSLLEALAADAVNAWMEAKRNSRWDLFIN